MKRGSLFSLVCLALLLGLGLVVAWLAFPMPAAAQPAQPQDTLFWSEDFSAPFSDTQYYITATPGSGLVMTDTFLLTQDAGNQRGRIFYLTPTLMDVFSATFSINLGVGNDPSGADGLAFHFCPVVDYPPSTGGFLDAGCPGGYFVAFDTWPNVNSEVYLAHGNVDTRLVNGASPGPLEDGAWHAAEVSLEAGVVTVVLDGVTLIDHYTIANYTPFVGYFGFSAGTGGEYNAQSVDTIQISTGASGSLAGTVYDELTGLPIAGATVSSGFFHAQTDADGTYTLPLPVGTYTVTAASLHYLDETFAGIEIITGTVVTQDFTLEPQGWLYGYVTDADGGFGLAATITVDNGASANTNPSDGYYELYLDPGSYVITATATHYLTQTASVALSTGQGLQQDFDLLYAIAFDPSPLEVTLTMGEVDTALVTLTNRQNTPYDFTFSESPGWYVPMAGEDVLVVANDTTAAAAMEAALTANGYTYLRVTPAAFNTTPVVDLLAYRAVFWAGNTDGTYMPHQMEYLDNGGNLYISENDLGYNNNSSVFYQTYLQATYNGDNGGDGVVTGLDIMAGLNPDITSDPYPDYFTVGAEGVEIFEFASGSSAGVLVARAGYKAIYTSWDFDEIASAADETELVRRVMVFLAPVDVPWFGIIPDSGTVPAGASLYGTATFTATAAVGVTQPGDYHIQLFVSGDPHLDVPVTMTVLPAVDMGQLSGTVLDHCTGEGVEASITITGGLPITQTSSDPDTGYYSVWLVEGTYDVQFAAPDHLPYTTTVSVIAGQVNPLVVALTPDGACIAVAPASLSADVCPDTLVTQTLQICNLGGDGPLNWNFAELVPYEVTVGSTASPWNGGARDRGNIFEITQTRMLNEIRVYLNISAATDIYFVVYEGTAVTGAYTQIHQNQVFNLGPGEGWYSSGTINMTLEAGKFYYIAASWNASATYYRSGEATPLTVPGVGILHTGIPATLSGYPPAATINNTYGSGYIAPYHFQLVTGSGGDAPWASTAPISGSLGADTCQAVTVTFDSTGLGWGDYDATLVISSTALNAPALGIPVAMTVLQPMEILSVTYLADVLSVAFTPSITGSPPIDYLWDFGDGITSTESNPVHAYAAGGYYTATLLASNACAVDTWSEAIWVCDPVYDAGFAWSPPTPVAGETASFTATASGTGPFTFEWDFGGGITDTGQYVEHAFAAEGTYAVTLTVSGACGMDTVVHEVIVAAACVAPAGADFAWMPVTPLVDAVVAFTGTLASGSGPLAWEWDFGDGITDTSQYASHAFTASGTYTVTLTVRNGCGEVSVSYEIIVEQPFTRIYLPMLKKN